ncbi:nitroreductase family protein [Cellvibrio japonicus]|uniref:Putative NAD(P)H nitroreductase n=1 Tax=Cellvibrio japonicus (strain Ueda107) TaxID=498211 RepID=B3PE51_CELJU|nr:nitroreductase family protein [Cellvibrio japonicus]ACE86174.1 nitroreductase family protein [Cellvibrio japonicus Ueda107]QEI12096.1 nitroreductase [Cellvibrio japonicus]QEI15670.1 nitroreductase [Cellvibrio japonicus]QEI19248.1 nitroreductase [Cellvibrio japonicus]
MDAIKALHERVSVAKLAEPGPSMDQCRSLIRAALRAADHGNLQPWRFLLVQGEGRRQLGELFVSAARAKGEPLGDAAIERFKSMPLRAPMVMVVIARTQEHPKVPIVEQQYSAAAAAQNVVNAAYALGLGAIWRTGDLAYDPGVAAGLGLAEGESIIGFIYIGTPINSPEPARESNPDIFFQFWP